MKAQIHLFPPLIQQIWAEKKFTHLSGWGPRGKEKESSASKMKISAQNLVRRL